MYCKIIDNCIIEIRGSSRNVICQHFVCMHMQIGFQVKILLLLLILDQGYNKDFYIVSKYYSLNKSCFIGFNFIDSLKKKIYMMVSTMVSKKDLSL